MKGGLIKRVADVFAPAGSPAYKDRCAKMLETQAGARSLQTNLLAQQAAAETVGLRAALLRKQVDEVNKAVARFETQAEIERALAVHGNRKAAIETEVENCARDHEHAARAVAEQERTLKQLEMRAEPIVKAAETAAEAKMAEATSREEEAHQALVLAEESGDDDAARTASERLLQARAVLRGMGDLQTPEGLRAGVVSRQVEQARTTLHAARNTAAQAATQLALARSRAAQYEFDRKLFDLMLAAATVERLRCALPLDSREKLPSWDLPRVQGFDPNMIPFGPRDISPLCRALPTRYILRMGEIHTPPDLSVFEVDPTTVSGPPAPTTGRALASADGGLQMADDRSAA